MSKLENKVIVVTGAFGQLGHAVSMEIAKQGGTGVLISRSTKSCATLYDQICAAGYTEPALFPLDFHKADEAKFDELALGVGQLFGRCDGIIHCAGVLEKLCPVVHFPPALWHKTLAVELTGPFLLTQRLLPLLQQSMAAQIVYTTHPIGKNPKAYWAALAAAKAGLENFAQVLHEELESQAKVKVNCVTPPPFQSRSYSKLYPGRTQSDLPSATQIAKYLVGLFDPEAMHQSGKNLVITQEALPTINTSRLQIPIVQV